MLVIRTKLQLQRRSASTVRFSPSSIQIAIVQRQNNCMWNNISEFNSQWLSLELRQFNGQNRCLICIKYRFNSFLKYYFQLYKLNRHSVRFVIGRFEVRFFNTTFYIYIYISTSYITFLLHIKYSSLKVGGIFI